MELRDIKEIIKILKKEEMSEIKVRYGKVKLTLINSDGNDNLKNEKIKIISENKKEIEKKNEEIIISKNVGKIKLENLEKGMEIFEGMILAKIITVGVETEIKSHVRGILKDILILDKSMVDYGKQLFVVELL